MAIVMKRNYNIPGNYTEEEKAILRECIDIFRLKTSDDDPEKNILNKKMQQYSDAKIVSFLQAALGDLNSGFPKTNYDLIYFSKNIDSDLIVDGAIIFAMIAEGILQLRNQVDFSDSGLSIAMFNKTGMYQGWASFLLQEYMRVKQELKSSVLPRSHNAGFVGIGSEFGYDGW